MQVSSNLGSSSRHHSQLLPSSPATINSLTRRVNHTMRAATRCTAKPSRPFKPLTTLLCHSLNPNLPPILWEGIREITSRPSQTPLVVIKVSRVNHTSITTIWVVRLPTSNHGRTRTRPKEASTSKSLATKTMIAATTHITRVAARSMVDREGITRLSMIGIQISQ